MGDVDAMNGFEGLMADQVLRWDFNVFDLTKSSGGRPLRHVTMSLLEKHGLLDNWKLNRATVDRYLTTVEDMYRPNPYHNHTHAADVTQTAGIIMTALDCHLRGAGCNNNSSNSNSCSCSCSCSNSCCGAPGGHGSSSTTSSSNNRSNSTSSSSSGGGGGRLPATTAAAAASGLIKLEIFAIIMASAVHDLGHPGVNNAYLVRTRDVQAVTYNDRSVNENMHASLAFKLALDHPELNIFANFSQEEYEQLRRLMLDMILSTDMDVHFALLKRFEDALAAQPDVRTWSTPEQRSLLCQMLVHLADLANPSRPWHLALHWAEWVVTEFLAQGMKEATAGIPISPPCDESKVCMPAAQLFFIDRFCGPTLTAFRSAAPAFYDMAAPWLADTTARWQAFKAAGVTFPLKGYPTLPPRTPAEQAGLWTTLGGRPCCCGACKQQQTQAVAVAAVGRQQQQQQEQQQQCPPAVAPASQQPMAAIQLQQAAAG